MTPKPAAAPACAAVLDALRARGAAERDPVRWHFLEALARRASAYEGAARRVLDERLAQLVAETHQRLDTAPHPQTEDAVSDGATPRQALAALARLARPESALSVAPGPAEAVAGPPANMLSIRRELHRTWSRLSAQQRLAQSLSSLPDNAGPLNARHVMHQALSLMHELSPACFERFVSQVDALLWLEQSLRKPGA